MASEPMWAHDNHWPGLVETAHYRLEIDAPPPRRPEIPVAARRAELGVATEGAGLGGHRAPPHVLHVHVKHPRAEFAKESGIIHPLVSEVRRIKVEPEVPVILHGGECAPGGGDIERDFGRMYLEREIDVELRERIEYRPPSRGEIGEAGIDIAGQIRREGVDPAPDAGAGKSVHDGAPRPGEVSFDRRRRHVEEASRGFGGVDHFLRRAAPHAFGITVSPDMRGYDRSMPGIDPVAHRLADQMIADREAGKTVIPEQLPLRPDIPPLPERATDVEVIAPAGQLEPVIAPRLRFGGEGFERKVGPLTGEQRDGTGHCGEQ